MAKTISARMSALALLSLLAACGGGGSALPPTTAAATAPAPMAPKPLSVVVVGDSISAGYMAPSGVYYKDAALSWPGELATQTGDIVTNLAIPGAQTTATTTLPNGTTIPPMISTVPQIPPNADVVVYEGGVNDLAWAWPVLDRIDTISAAIRAQAPTAKIIYMGLRHYAGSGAGVALWNGAEQTDAPKYGATFLDMIPPWPAGVSPAWPDGTHPSATTAAQIATMVNAVVSASIR